MPVRIVKPAEARAHLVAIAQDLRAAHLDFYAEHVEWVLRELLPENRVAHDEKNKQDTC